MLDKLKAYMYNIHIELRNSGSYMMGISNIVKSLNRLETGIEQCAEDLDFFLEQIEDNLTKEQRREIKRIIKNIEALAQ